MARTPLLMGNWKMYKTVAEARAFAEALGQQSQKLRRPWSTPSARRTRRFTCCA